MRSNNMKSVWTREMFDELSNYSGVNFEESLSEMLRESLIRERCEYRKSRINKIFNL